METKIKTMLTGKCKLDFEKWFLKDVDSTENYDQYVLRSFLSKGLSMQYGVYVDFFDSVKIVIELQVRTTPTMQGGSFTCIRPSILSVGKFYNVGASFVVRDRARTEAIKKANEIYNKQQIIANVKKPNANIL